MILIIKPDVAVQPLVHLIIFLYLDGGIKIGKDKVFTRAN